MSLGLDPSPGRGPATLRMGIVVFAALVLMLQQSVIARSWPVRVDSATLVVVFLALETPFWTGLWTSLVVGYLAGLYSGVPAAMDAAVAAATYVVIRVFVARVVGSRWLMVTTTALMATAGAILGRVIVSRMLSPNPAPWSMVAPSVPAQLVAAAALGWPVFRILQWVQLQLTPRDERG